jgi:hypothetical protein
VRRKNGVIFHTLVTYEVILNVYSNSDSLLFSVIKNQFNVNNYLEVCKILKYQVILNVYSDSDSLLFSVIKYQFSVNNYLEVC